MPDVYTQTPMTGNRIETVLKELGRLRQAKYNRTQHQKRRANKRMADQVGKRMAEHIVGARSLSWASATLSSGATAAAGAACTLEALARPVKEKTRRLNRHNVSTECTAASGAVCRNDPRGVVAVACSVEVAPC